MSKQKLKAGDCILDITREQFDEIKSIIGDSHGIRFINGLSNAIIYSEHDNILQSLVSGKKPTLVNELPFYEFKTRCNNTFKEPKKIRWDRIILCVIILMLSILSYKQHKRIDTLEKRLYDYELYIKPVRLFYGE